LRPLQCPRTKKCSAIAYEKILNSTIERICQDLPPTIAQISLPDLEGIKRGMSEEIGQKKRYFVPIALPRSGGNFRSRNG